MSFILSALSVKPPIAAIGPALPPAFLPIIGTTVPSIFADFTTEGTTNHYWSNSSTHPGFVGWLANLLGTFTRASSATFTNSSGVLVPNGVGSNVARFDYNPTSLASNGIFLEQTGTNLQLQSNALTTSPWLTGNVTINGTQPGVDGTNSGWQMVEDNTNNVHNIIQLQTFLASTLYTVSAYYNKGTARYAGFYDASITGAFVIFDLQLGTVLTSGGGGTPTGAITKGPNGFFRCSMTFNSGAGGAGGLRFIISNSSGNTSFLGDGVSYVYITDCQLEASPYVSSYIPTTTVSATRAADSLTVPFSAPQATFFESVSLTVDPAVIGVNNALLQVSSGALPLYIASGGDQLFSFNGSSNLSGPTLTWLNTTNLIAVSGNTTSSRGMSANGAAAITDTNPLLSAYTSMTISAPTSGAPGDYAQFAAWSIQATPSQLQALT